MIKTTFIYALKDPKTGEVRYIGKSDHPEERLHQHIRAAKGDKGNKTTAWINNVLLAGNAPVFIILEEVNIKDWQRAEQKWISFYRRETLTNMTEGGNAPPQSSLGGEEVYDTKEAAKLLHISYMTLYRWIKKGKIIPLKLNHRTLILKSEIARLKLLVKG